MDQQRTPRLPALLAGRSLAVAYRIATTDFGWRPIAQDRYLTPEGEEVRAVADRSSFHVGLPLGTRIYLLDSWQLRDDWRRIDGLLQIGNLVRAPLPLVRMPRLSAAAR
ncbi:hypothetical protein IAI58_22625 (plasmid) [Roseomonas marmotae]|uniref:hypothetical protein n=1 Tax=Roseomonas marmotae TaxID=2768161 RepID=UPI001AD6DCDB|nr:hypothetical protein [Roseomonas marmotae]QTI82151.1 hypothetical protein IAI58_22625 [Roseomonas marmotae]